MFPEGVGRIGWLLPKDLSRSSVGQGRRFLLSRGPTRPLQGVPVFTAVALLAVLTFWNGGLIFRWGAHLTSVHWPVSFSDMAHTTNCWSFPASSPPSSSGAASSAQNPHAADQRPRPPVAQTQSSAAMMSCLILPCCHSAQV
jgi:hypothetical protein